MPSTAPDTEVEAYKFILDQLKEVGWNSKNPSRNADGHVWTQGQCHAHPEIKKALGGTKPENIVRLSEKKLWVIEAKRDRGKLKKALSEAEHDYARPLIDGGYFGVPLITGVAGNDETGYEVRTHLFVKGKYLPVVINGTEATGFLDPKTVETLLKTGQPIIADFAVDESVFIKAAERIPRRRHQQERPCPRHGRAASWPSLRTRAQTSSPNCLCSLMTSTPAPRPFSGRAGNQSFTHLW
jgi:type I restriction enzyme M protein